MKEVSNNALAVLVIAAIAISAASTMTMLSMLGKPAQITGFVGSESAQGSATVTVAQECAIKLVIPTVAFGTLGVGENNDTWDLSPPPFELENNGSVCANVSVGASALWGKATTNSIYYRYNATNNGSTTRNAINSTITYMNITTMAGVGPSNANVVENLSFQTAVDSIHVHIAISVPNDETPGAKTSSVYFKAVTDPGC